VKRLCSILVGVILTVLALSAFATVSGNVSPVSYRWPRLFTSIFSIRTATGTASTRAAVSPYEAPVLVPLIFVVTSTGDAADASPGNGVCATATPVVCTLRAAIEEANATPDADTIRFAIPVAGVQTIIPASALPVISQPVTIDGYTQPGSKVNELTVGDDAIINIELDGAGLVADGLNISAGNCTVRGLAIFSFGGDGIDLNTNNTNSIVGNFIGTNSGGLLDLGNGDNGVQITSASNAIGSSALADRNIISGNDGEGVSLFVSGATLNTVAGNYIGTDRTGTADLGNSDNGVFVGGPSNTIGGSTATPGQGAGNVISGNTLSGVRISTDGNSNTVAGNLIGLQANGTTALGNSNNGVFMSNAAEDNTVGGTAANLRNIISSNTGAGVRIDGEGTTGNMVQGNYIGTDAGGTLDRGNTADGVLILAGATVNTVGGLTGTPGTAPGNVISGNNGDGIEINTGTPSPNNTVQGNLIGTNASGTGPVRNSDDGVRIISSANNLIGGSTATARNVIVGGTGETTDDGVDIQGSAAAANTVAGNYIGTDINGTGDFGAGGDGVRISASADNNPIGGSTATPGTPPGNVISGNDGDGVEISGSATAANLVQGNLIGLQANGTTALSNGGSGVLISTSGTAPSTVGGVSSGLGNIIAFNGGDGVYVSTGVNNIIRRNSIHSNTGLGIDLGADGVTPNDTDDPDTGANLLQNFPVITNAQQGSTTISGTLNSTPSTTFTIEFFSNTTADPTAHGEGQTFLDSITVTTDSGGDVAFSHTAATTVPLGHVITATATDPNGNTSEFSNTRLVVSATFARLREFRATRYGDGTIVDWRTEREVDNLGFRLYREDAGRRTLLTPSMVAGSALTVGPGNRLTAGYSYSWFDPQGSPDSVYALESVDLDGSSEWAGPIYPAAGAITGKARETPRHEQAMLLNEIAASRDQSSSASFANVTSWPSTMNITPSSRDTKLSNSLSQPNSLSIQQRIAAGKAVKVHVRKSGWYRVTLPELVAAGFDPTSDARLLQLYVDGEEVPISLSTESARLSDTDSLEFYGVPLDTPTTDAHVYWLISGTSPGKRMIARRGKLKPADPYSEPAPGGFDLTVQWDEKVLYFSSLRNGDAENLFGAPVLSNPVNQTLPVKYLDLDSVSQSQIEIGLQGLTLLGHQVQVKVNGETVGSMMFAGREHEVAAFPVNLGLLREGDNVVSLSSLNGSNDISLIDFIRLTYPRQYKAENNTLRFSAPGGQPVRVEGFTDPKVRVVDVTDPNAPTQVTARVTKSGTAYSVKVQSEGNGGRTLLAFTEGLMSQPAAITPNQPSSWSAPTNGADMVIVTHKNFRASIEPLANLRRSQGLSVAIVDVEDLYDEFSYGAHSPIALKAFLVSAAANWTSKPAYLLLVGDSSWDPRNYLNRGDSDFVPTKLIDTQTMETASDDWFADLNAEGLASIAVGRLPVRTPADSNLMVTKIISYEQERELRAPLREALMVADSGFEEQSSQTWGILPFNITVRTINRAEVGNDEIMRGKIVDALNQGPMIVNYYGHGSSRVWTGAGLLNADLAGGLTNTNRLSVYAMMTCLNGYASDPTLDSLGEALLKAPNGGAVAVWASSGFTTPQPQFEMNREFYRLLFGGQPMRLGEAIRRAKAATSDMDVRRTWILLGDPAMRIR